MKPGIFKKLKIPDRPGIYLFKKNKEIFYIGKATSLRDRVKSYFPSTTLGASRLEETRGLAIVDMVFKANKIDWRETDSVLEALILEAGLIKKYQPKYNTKEKSDKSFNYVCITKEKLPRVIVVRGKDLLSQRKVQRNFSSCALLWAQKGEQSGTLRQKNFAVPSSGVFGPFPNNNQLKEALKIIRKIFPFLDDKSKNYLEFYRQINLAPDLNDTKLYKQNIKNIKLFFPGKKKQILRNLKKEMLAYSKTREFEKAGEIKRQIFALQHINDVALIKDDFRLRQSVSSLRKSAMLRIEAYDIAHLGGKNMVGVMTVVEDGEVTKSEYKKFKIRTQNNANDTGALMEVLERRLAHPEWSYPDLIVVDGSTAQINSARKILTRLNLVIPVVSVVKNEQHKTKAIMGNAGITTKYKREILLANSEAHRFAIAYHKKMRNKNFLTK